MEPKSLKAGPDYAEGLINKMKTVFRRSPDNRLHQGHTAQSGQQAFTGKPTWPGSPPDGMAASLMANRRPFFLLAVALMAALAVSLSLLWTGGFLQAQQAGCTPGDNAFCYPENDTAPVATFTAVDPEGKAIVWSLAGDDAGDFSIVNGVLSFEEPPDFEDPQGGSGNDSTTYSVTVQASDGGADTTATEMLTVEVTNVEEPGTVMLSTLQPQVAVAITATLTDPDNIAPGTNDAGTITTGTWQWLRGQDEIVGATNASYTPSEADIGSVLRATVEYDDEEGEDKTAQEDSAHAVRAAPETNVPPVFPDQTADPQTVVTAQTREVAESVAVGTNLGDPVAASDPDVLTYSVDGTDVDAVEINRATGQLSTARALNYETSADQSLIVTVTATDPFGATATSEVTITVTDVNEDPTLTGASSIDHEEGTTVLDVDATDPAADPAEYTATDEDDADDAATGLSWMLRGADASKFEITDTGATRVLSFMDAPDFESPEDSGRNNVYDVTIRVTDSEGNTAEQAVTVKVTNMEEDGTVDLSTLQPRVGFPVTASLMDPDNVNAESLSWQWYKGTVTANNLPDTECVDNTSNNCFIGGAASETYIPVNDDVQNTLSAVATYTDGKANEGDAKDVALQPTAQTVLADTRNKAPVFPDQDMEMEGDQTDQERSIAERNTDGDPTPAGEDIGDPVTAMDFITANNGDQTAETLTYSLGGPDAASFSIVRATGQLQTKAELDKETKDTYVVMVTATDPSNESATIMVTITVTDVDEAPIIMLGGLAISGSSAVSYAENGTGAIGTYTAVGEDAASAVWGLEGTDRDDFDIVNGILTFSVSPDYENARDSDTDNVYNVTVVARAAGNMAMHDVTVTVTDVDEAPPADDAAVLEKWDDSGNGSIEKLEYLMALNAYLDSEIQRLELLQVLNLYLG